MSQAPSYIAFISYRHLPLDMEAAKRIQKKIENYTIPKELREEFGGKKFGHVFRDEDELPSTASLSDSIYTALDNSQFLIVICTPDLPQSKWCEAEIRYFLKTHDRDHILAVLVDGDPEESFSPYMLHAFDGEGNPIADYEPLAANINGPGHTINRKAFGKEITRLFAAFLGCPFDSLWQRERRARVNRILSASAVVIAVLCAFLGVLLNRNARISEQNKMIEAQNTQLQSRLSSVLVNSGIAKLEDHDIAGAIEDALSSLESGDPAVYDHRAGKLLADSLGAYQQNKMRSLVVYSQPTGITGIQVTDDKKHMLLLDEVGVLRCLELTTHEPLWEVQTGQTSADRESLDVNTRVYSRNLGDRVIYKDAGGIHCLSLADGTVLWTFGQNSDDPNAFQAISDDGSLFAAVEGDEERGASEIIFINTADGTERGRIDLTDNGMYVPSIWSSDKDFEFAAAFSPDNSRFAYIIQVEEAAEETADDPAAEDEEAEDKEAEDDLAAVDEEAEDDPAVTDEETADQQDVKKGYGLWYVDMNTLEKHSVAFIEEENSLYLFYGMDIDPADDSIFMAAYTRSSIYTLLCTGNGDRFDFKEKHVTHKYKAKGGMDFVDDYFDATDCRFLSKNGRVYVISDNQLLVYGRAENELYNFYPLTGSIVNAYWADPENNEMEVLTEDGYITGYTMAFDGNKIINRVYANRSDQDIVSKSCPAGNGTVSEGGSLYMISRSAPGKLFMTEFVSDPNRKTLLSGEKSGFDNDFSFLISEYSDTGFLLYRNGKVESFDKRSGERRKTTSFDEELTGYEAIILDDDHFLIGNERYGMDGTVDSYAAPSGEDYEALVPYQAIRLSDGQILSWDEYTLYGLEADESSAGSGKFTDGYPQGVALWLDGKPVESLNDPENTALFYNDVWEISPLTMVGENGLILQYGYPINLAKDTFTVRDQKELCLIDAASGKATAVETPVPAPENIKAALAHGRKLCAVADESGAVSIYDAESGSAAPLEDRYVSNEIMHICFSDNDAYLLVLTSSRRLDIYETEGYRKVYSERIDSFEEALEMYSTDNMRAQVSQDGGILFLTLGTKCLIVDAVGWTEISDFGANAVVYDKETGRVYSSDYNYEKDSEGIPEVIVYPCYDIPALAEWGRTNRGAVMTGYME